MRARIWHHPYTLCFSAGGEANAEGSLLKYDFGGGQIGYASLPAWPQVHDRTLAAKLENLKTNPRLEPQWSWASLDARLRSEHQPALPANTHLPASHCHFRTSDLRDPERWPGLVASGYTHAKLKVTPSMLKDSALSSLAKFAGENSVKLRLDGNGSFTSVEELDALFEAVGDTSVIDFFEDPSTDEKLWAEIKRRWGVSLAADWLRPERYDNDLVIHKPSRDFGVPEGKEFVVTTAFDHPLGLNYTAYRSLQLEEYPGFRTPLGIEHPRLYTCDGLESEVTFGAIGFGWGDMLEDLPWRPL